MSKTRITKGPCESVELEGLQHTSIPVSKVHQTYRVDGHLYIEMDYTQGDTLQAIWTSGILSPSEKQAIAKQVADYINQLRMLEPPQKGAVASATLGQCLDYRVGYSLFGPFSSNEEFHSFLRGYIPLESCTQVYGEDVTRCHTRRYRTYLGISPTGTSVNAILSCTIARFLRSLIGNLPDSIRNIGNTQRHILDSSIYLKGISSLSVLYLDTTMNWLQNVPYGGNWINRGWCDIKTPKF